MRAAWLAVDARTLDCTCWFFIRMSVSCVKLVSAWCLWHFIRLMSVLAINQHHDGCDVLPLTLRGDVVAPTVQDFEAASQLGNIDEMSSDQCLRVLVKPNNVLISEAIWRGHMYPHAGGMSTPPECRKARRWFQASRHTRNKRRLSCVCP
jgi:hypothetical protein